MAKVTSYSQLLAELEKARDKALKGAGEKAVDVAKDRVDKDVYAASKGDPKEYIRTYQLRDSIVADDFKTNGNTAEIKVKHDTDLIQSISPNQHYSVVDDSSSVDSIADIVHGGKSGRIFSTGYWTEPRPYMSNAKEILENGEYRKFMKEELEKQGYKTK